jgi:hypothetical protein
MPPDDKYKSIAQDNYTSQMRIPVMPFRPKEYPEPPVDPIETVPNDTISKFFGMRGNNAGNSYYSNDEHLEDQDRQNDSEVKLSYEEARRMASS